MGTVNATLLSAALNTKRVNATFSWAKMKADRWNDLEVVKSAGRASGVSVFD
jgi:hypothetical protein